MDMNGGWVLSIDIAKFFDTIDHAKLRKLVEQRVRDGVILRLIGKWLNAGVCEKGQIHYPEDGSPQGGVVSPLLSNIYLHYILDQWFEMDVKPRLKGCANLVRFADDALIVFASKEDAARVMEVLPKRFAKYGLTIHPSKTHLVEFNRPRVKPGELRQDRRPGTFNFLGFTHYWGSTRKGGWAVKRKTARDRLSRGIKKIAEWCSQNLHKPLKDQHVILSAKVRGHFNYYGIPGNSWSLGEFRYRVERVWREWL